MSSSYKHVVSLGSSFAAGPSIEPVADPNALRSKRNYAALLAQRLGARHTDLTVSGATTANVLHEPQVPYPHRWWHGRATPFPPQIEGVPADADLVTITIGGCVADRVLAAGSGLSLFRPRTTRLIQH